MNTILWVRKLNAYGYKKEDVKNPQAPPPLPLLLHNFSLFHPGLEGLIS